MLKSKGILFSFLFLRNIDNFLKIKIDKNFRLKISSKDTTLYINILLILNKNDFLLHTSLNEVNKDIIQTWLTDQPI